MATQTSSKSIFTSILSAFQPFTVGGASGLFATCIAQPLDMVKVTAQIQSQQFVEFREFLGSFIVAHEQVQQKIGFRGFYCGMSAALMREFIYGSVRYGVYKKSREWMKSSKRSKGKKNQLTFYEKSTCAGLAGFLGALLACPADLVLIRMQADPRIQPDSRRNYKNVVDGLKQIHGEEGIKGLWRGVTPTVIRSVITSIVLFQTYEQVKQIYKLHFKEEETWKVRIGSGVVAGFWSSVYSLPFDMAKTKIQKMQKNSIDMYPMKTMFQAMWKTIINEGFAQLWVGLPVSSFRIGLHGLATVLAQDYLSEAITGSPTRVY